MRGKFAEVAAVAILATIITTVIAAPVLRAPSERAFGMAIVGRHHDPFTAMQQFEAPIRIGVYSQPVTDLTGAALARLVGGVAAYNWLVLLSFPLSAAAGYLLARHLQLSRAGALVAALAFAFSPFHLAHAAYHPQIAQTQWLPLYVLALWRCVEKPSPLAIGALSAAAVAVTLSNFYGGLVAATVTPVALGAYWLATRREYPQPLHRLALTAGSLVCIAAAGILYAWWVAGPVLAGAASFEAPRDDLFIYSAKWWSYLVPPVESPLFGSTATRIWHAAGVTKGLLEQQVGIGFGIILLAIIAITSKWRTNQPVLTRARPALVAVAVTALVFSLSPERTIGTFTYSRPSALLFAVAPMFRSYARFGVVVQLMAAILAGIGVDRLLQLRTRWGHALCIALLAIATAEYAVSPSAMWRDVLPTAAHRWVMQQPGSMKVLDCTQLTAESASVPWLTGGRAHLLGGLMADCSEPYLSKRLSANGYTHVLARRGSAGEQLFPNPLSLDGLNVAARFDDGQVFSVTAAPPAIYTVTMTKFSPRERDGEWSWRWMGSDGAWMVVNSQPKALIAAVDVEMVAFHQPRRLELRLDGHPVQTLDVEPARRTYQIGPLTVLPGSHELSFHPVEAPTIAREVIDNNDPRPLSFALGTWNWAILGERQ